MKSIVFVSILFLFTTALANVDGYFNEGIYKGTITDNERLNGQECEFEIYYDAVGGGHNRKMHLKHEPTDIFPEGIITSAPYYIVFYQNKENHSVILHSETEEVDSYFMGFATEGDRAPIIFRVGRTLRDENGTFSVKEGEDYICEDLKFYSEEKND